MRKLRGKFQAYDKRHSSTLSTAIPLAGLSIALLLSGCAESGATSSAFKGNLKITGSTALEPLVHTAALSFMKLHPQVHIDVQGGGSITGLRDVTSKKSDIGNSDIYADPALYPDPNMTDHIVCVILNQQTTLSSSALRTWHIYQSSITHVLIFIKNGQTAESLHLEQFQVEPTNADALSALRALIQFDSKLATSVQDAANVEQQFQYITTIISSVIAFLAIMLIGWIISGTVVRRLNRLREVTKDVEQGQLISSLAQEIRTGIISFQLDTVEGSNSLSNIPVTPAHGYDLLSDMQHSRAIPIDN